MFADMLSYILQERLNLHSLMVVRHSKTLFEAYFYPYTSQSVHDIRSSAKSVVALLVGIAIEQGYIQSIHQPVLEFFPERSFKNVDSRKQAMTVEHLLHMTSGLEWSDADVHAMMNSSDWLQFVLDGNMTSQPGTAFVYSTPNTYLLSAILHKVTGISALAFARRHLFDPLTIGEVRWQTDPQGVNMGGMGMWMPPRDMALIGQWCLQKGLWGNRHLVSEAWIQACTTSHDGEYGYLWWVDEHFYYASGYGGQMIFVLPESDAVVVVTAGLADAPTITKNLVKDFIIPAFQSVDTPESANLLSTYLHQIAHPQPKPIPPFPAIVGQISGKNFRLQANPLQWTDFQFDFQADSATLTLVMNGDKVTLPIGLDGMVRVQPVEKLGFLSDHDPLGLTGHWHNETTFFLHLEIINNPENWHMHFDFERNQLEMTDKIQNQTDKLTWSSL